MRAVLGTDREAGFTSVASITVDLWFPFDGLGVGHEKKSAKALTRFHIANGTAYGAPLPSSEAGKEPMSCPTFASTAST